MKPEDELQKIFKRQAAAQQLTPRRDALIRELKGMGWSGAQIARLAPEGAFSRERARQVTKEEA